MRVFYPISARISDMVNDEKVLQSGWTTIWSMLSIGVLAVVLASLSSVDGGAAEKQHELFTKNHNAHGNHLVGTHTQRMGTSGKAGNA